MSFLIRRNSSKDTKEKKNESKTSSGTGSTGGLSTDVSEFRKIFEGITVKSLTLGPTLGTGTFGRVRLVTYSHQNKPFYFALKMLKKN